MANTITRIIGIGELGGKFIHKNIKTPTKNVAYIAMDYVQSRLDTILAHHKLLLTQTEQDKASITQLLQAVDFVIIFVDLDKDEDTQIAINILDSLARGTLAIVATRSTQENTQIQSKLAQLKEREAVIIHSCTQQEMERQGLSVVEIEKYIEEKWLQLTMLPALFSSNGFISVDLEDIRVMFLEKNNCDLFFVSAKGKYRILHIFNNLYVQMQGKSKMTNVLVSIQGTDIELKEIDDLLNLIASLLTEDASIAFGMLISDKPLEELSLIILASF